MSPEEQKAMHIKVSKLDVLIRNVNDDLPNAMDNLINFLDGFEDPLQLAFVLLCSQDLLTELMAPRYNSYWEGELQSCAPSAFQFKTPRYFSLVEFWMNYLLHLDCVERQYLYSILTLRMLPPEKFDLHTLIACINCMSYQIYFGELDIAERDSFINIFKAALPLHGTPGYLGLAALYCVLATKKNMDFLEAKDPKVRAELLKEQHALSYQVLKYVKMAEIVAADSLAEIHNAYYGKKLFDHLAIPKVTNFADLSADYIKKLKIPADEAKLAVINNIATAEFNRDEPAYLDRQDRMKKALQEKYLANAKKEGRNQYSETTLLTAARTGDLEGLIKILSATTSYRATDHVGNSILHLAVMSNNEKLVDFLVKKYPALVKLQNNYDCTAFDLAESEAIKQIITKKSGKPPIFFATSSNTQNIGKPKEPPTKQLPLNRDCGY